MNLFTPTGSTVNLAVTSTTGNVALGTLPSTGGGNIMVTNTGTAMVFIEFGGASTIEAAVATSSPVLAGSQVVFAIGPAVTHFAAITGTGTATVYATPGQGV